MLLKHLPKQLVVRESMDFQNIRNCFVGSNDVFIDPGKTDFVLVFQKGHSHAFLEKTAEIFGLEHCNTGNLLQWNCAVIIIGYVMEHRL